MQGPMRHRLQVQVTAASLWSTDHGVGFQGRTYCVKDLALVQHLHRTTSTSTRLFCTTSASSFKEVPAFSYL